MYLLGTAALDSAVCPHHCRLGRCCHCHRVYVQSAVITPGPHTPSSCSDEREQPLTYSRPRCPIYTQWLQQRPSHLIDRLAVHTTPAPGLRGTAAQQTQAFPHHPAAVRQ